MKIISIKAREMKFDINFDHPEKLNSHDVIEIRLNFNEFEPQVSTEIFTTKMVNQAEQVFGHQV